MPLIRKFTDEVNYTEFEVESIADFYKESVPDLKAGYHFYKDSINETNDVTLNHNELLACDLLIMYRPVHGGLVAWIVGGIIAILSVAASLFLMPSIEAPANSNRDQNSSTNSFGDRENELRLGERVDDIWGKVSRFSPSLIQVPHYRYIDDVQHEFFACAYMGKCWEDNHRDGDTWFSRLDSAKYNKWNPGSDLTSTPDFVIGGEIGSNLNSITISDELQNQELLAPNDLDVVGTQVWTMSNSNGVARLTLTNYNELEVDLADHYLENSTIVMIDCLIVTNTQPNTVYLPDPVEPVLAPPTTHTLTEVSGKILINGNYSVLSSAESYIDIDTSNTGWSDFSTRSFTDKLYSVSTDDGEKEVLESSVIGTVFYGEYLETIITPPDREPYNEYTYQNPYNYTSQSDQDPVVGSLYEYAIGPIQIKDNCDLITCNLVASNGFYNLYKGNEQRVTITVRFDLQELDESGTSTGNFRVIDKTFTSHNGNLTMQAALTVDIENNYEYAHLIVRRMTDKKKGSKYANADNVNWQDLYFTDYVALPDNSDITVSQVQIPYSTTAIAVKKRVLNFDAIRMHQPYQRGGTWGPEQPIETWAETLIGNALDRHNGRLDLENIDAETLLDVQDQMVEYYGTEDAVKVGYDLDSTSLRFQDIYKLFCNAVNANGYSQGGVFKAYADIARDNSSKQFTLRYKVPGTDSKSRSYSQENDGVELTYRSNETGDFETVVRHVNGIDSYNRKDIELSGAVTEAQAVIRANREMAYIKYLKQVYTFDADGIGRLTVLGERVDHVDMTRIVKRENNLNKYQVYSGYVVDVDHVKNLLIEVSEDIYFEDGEAHSIRFTDKVGALMDVISCSKSDISKRHIVLHSAPSSELYIGYKKERTAFTLASDAARNSLPAIVRSVEQADDDGYKTVTIKAVNYDERYFQNDKEFSTN